MSREQQVFGAVWPDGIPASERVIYEAVPPEDRPQVIERLDAAFRAANGEPWKPLADKLGLKRSAFYDLRNGWKERKLSGVIPYDRRVGRRLVIKEQDPLRSSARDLLRSRDRGTRNVDIAKRLLETHGGLAEDAGYNARLSALQRIERLVQEERRELARDRVYLERAYGQRIVIDLTAVSIVLDLPDPSLAVVAIVLEEASGLIMGSVLDTLDDAAGAQAAAIDASIEFLQQRKADVAVSGLMADLVVTLAPGSRPDSTGEAELAEKVRDLDVGHGTYAFGQNLVQTVGPRVGRMTLAPRRTLTIDAAKHLENRKADLMTLSMARARWEREVTRHNQPILEGLAEAGLVDCAGAGDGVMARALRATSNYLSGIYPSA